MFNLPALAKLSLSAARSPLSIFISVKGIVIEDGKVWLRQNERGIWELPGGRMEPEEQPAETLVRELREELGFAVEAGKLVHAHLTKGFWLNRVLILVYTTKLLSKPGEFELQGEFGKASFQAFGLDELPEVKFPVYYREAIEKSGALK